MSNGALMLDYRTMMHHMATGITPAMAQSAVGRGSAFAFTPHDAQGRFLDRGKTYWVTLPAPVPAKEFWSFTIWFAPTAPAGKEGNWVQTLPGTDWSALLRLYGPLEPWFDKTWKPGDFELVDEGATA